MADTPKIPNTDTCSGSRLFIVFAHYVFFKTGYIVTCALYNNNAILLFIIAIVPVRGNNIIFNDLPNTINYQKTLYLPVRTSPPQRSQYKYACVPVRLGGV